jgi:hypothetical protein
MSINMNPSRLGQVNTAGDVKQLFLLKYAGEVLKAFNETTQFISRHMVRTIDHGKSAQFPATGKGTALYHTPGQLITGLAVPHAERIITIDDLLIAPRSIASIDEAMNHYDVRSIYSADAGRELARTFDLNVARVGILTARATATVTGLPGGSRIVSANSKTNAQALIAAVKDAAVALDQKDVPADERFVFVTPAQYYMLVESGDKALNVDYNPEGNGSIASGKIFRLFGMELVKTNNLPQTNVTTGPTQYRGDFSTTSALVMHKSACGTVKLLDLAVDAEWKMEYQAWLLIAKYAMGHGILRPESAVEIAVS